MKKMYEQLEEAMLRMDAVVVLAGMLNDGDAMADPLRELLEEEDDSTLQDCFPDMPASLLADRDDEALFRDSFSWWATQEGKRGFAVKFARPVMTFRSVGGSASFSWGHYHTAWLYGDTLNEAVQRGLQWANELEATDQARRRTAHL